MRVLGALGQGLRVVLSLMGVGLLGAFKGGALFGLVGVAVGAATWFLPGWLGAAPPPAWLVVLGVVVPPLALSASGGYAFMLQAVSGRLAHEAKERGVVGRVYAVLKPVTVQVAKRLQGKGALSREELSRVVDASVSEHLREAEAARGEAAAPKRTEVERFLMEQSRRVLGMLALRAVVSAPDATTAVRNLESLGLERVEMSLVERLEDLFFLQVVLAFGAGAMVAIAPAVLMVWQR
ncbi:hypothetical protein [Comamonas sp. JC664]|uniref:hypothetical protein n=1 Tax=Comamonas sp. JC664 TaxID=2801917 RepID=UPI00174DFB0A|nr:hypothetical protein [Comamonas sp. JC664]MBL0692721.1 hypothetical protein [Comamonas sp. JC664]GHG93463.1 hypothetical protein GCM10012319_55880 [Comamonas sp. KCTC 72670]